MSDIEYWDGKPGSWYVKVDLDQFLILQQVCPDNLSDFTIGTDGYYYALQSAIFNDEDLDALLMVFGDEENIPRAFLNLSVQASILP